MSLLGASLSERSVDPEWLDRGVGEEETPRNLADLRTVNRWLGARGALLAVVRAHMPPRGRLLDVGCASADVPAFLLGRLHAGVLAVGLEARALHLRGAASTVRLVVGDLRLPPFPEAAFDVVTASLVLHHFDDPVLPDLLRGLYRLARRALVVSDLHRATLPLLFGHLVFPLLFRSRVSVHDGLVSIRRGFRPEELRRAFVEAGVPQVRIRRRFPYRLLAVATHPEGAQAPETGLRA
jgi:SAM-dependent methyltransferase